MLAAAMLAALVGGLASLGWAQGPAEAAFPGDNGRLVFSAFRHGNTDVYSANPDGTGSKRLTDHPDIDGEPAVSPDGKRVLFTSGRNNAAGVEEVWVMRADGTNERRLTENADGDHAPQWSPDGEKIAFSRAGDGSDFGGRVFVMDLSSGRTRDLTPGFWAAGAPSWSPDGGRIGFVGDREGYGADEIHTVRPDGTGLKTLTSTSSDAHEFGLDWSPGGDRIAFATNLTGYEDCDPNGCDRLSEIYAMDRDGSDKVRLTRSPADDYHGDTYPAWSPDGSKIAFTRANDVFVMRADGTRERNVTGTPSVPELDPSWRPLPNR